MKNKILLLFTLAFLLISCSSNDDEKPFTGSSEDILGTWNITGLTTETSVTLTSNGQTVNSQESTEGKEFNATMVFSANTVKTAGSYNQVYTSTVNGDTTTSEEFVDVDDDTQTWSLSESTLIITDDSGDGMSLDVIEFTNNKLKLESTNNESSTGNNSTGEYTYSVVITLER
ncbi:MAG: hypothetical protein ACJA1B_002439 [Polaribacter sp.]|jgi:hypothetical protein